MLSTGKNDSKLPDNTISAFSSDKVICLATRSSKRFWCLIVRQSTVLHSRHNNTGEQSLWFICTVVLRGSCCKCWSMLTTVICSFIF